MMTNQAKRLKVGEKVVWSKSGAPVEEGVVTRKYYNTIYIQWADQAEPFKHYADTMNYAFTPQQLIDLETQARVAERVKELAVERRNKPYVWT